MPYTIRVGGGAGAFGQGLGEGAQEAIDQAQLEAKEQKAAEAMNQVTTAAWRAVVEEQERSQGFVAGTQDQKSVVTGPGQATVIGGKLPVFLTPDLGSDPDEAEFDLLVEKHDQALEAITDPEQRLRYANIAKGSLEGMRGELDKRRVEREIGNAVKGELLTQEQAEAALEKVRLAEDGRAARAEWESAVEKLKDAQHRRDAIEETFRVGEAWSTEAGEWAKTREDGEHWANVRDQLEVVRRNLDFAHRLYGEKVDPTPYFAEMQAIKNQLNTYQAAQRDKEVAKMERRVAAGLAKAKHERDMEVAKVKHERDMEVEGYKQANLNYRAELDLWDQEGEALREERDAIEGDMSLTAEERSAKVSSLSRQIADHRKGRPAAPDFESSGSEPKEEAKADPRAYVNPETGEPVKVIVGAYSSWEDWYKLPEANRVNKTENAIKVLNQELVYSDTSRAFIDSVDLPQTVDGILARVGIDPGSPDLTITEQVQRLDPVAQGHLAGILRVLEQVGPEPGAVEVDPMAEPPPGRPTVPLPVMGLEPPQPPGPTFERDFTKYSPRPFAD